MQQKKANNPDCDISAADLIDSIDYEDPIIQSLPRNQRQIIKDVIYNSKKYLSKRELKNDPKISKSGASKSENKMHSLKKPDFDESDLGSKNGTGTLRCQTIPDLGSSDRKSEPKSLSQYVELSHSTQALKNESGAKLSRASKKSQGHLRSQKNAVLEALISKLDPGLQELVDQSFLVEMCKFDYHNPESKK